MRLRHLGQLLKMSRCQMDVLKKQQPALFPRRQCRMLLMNLFVEEAWQVINESFLDTRHNSWSADAWLEKKQEVLKNPIRRRMAAYATIRNMLSSLNDPFTRFLTPDQFAQLSKYDVAGIVLTCKLLPFFEITFRVSSGYHKSIEVVSRKYHLGIDTNEDVGDSLRLCL